MDKMIEPKSIERSLIERVGVEWDTQVHALKTAESPGLALEALKLAYKNATDLLFSRGDYLGNIIKTVRDGLYVELEKIAFGDDVVPGPEEVFEPAYR